MNARPLLPSKPDRAPRSPGSPTASLRLTPSQTGLLFESLLDDKPGLNQLQILLRFGPAFNAEPVSGEALREAWEILTAHHAVLRLRLAPFAEAGPMQRVEPGLTPDFAELWLPDRDGEGDGNGAGGLAEWLAADQANPPDPTSGPAWRVRLLHLENGAVMVWSFHHALLDGGGYRLILAELLALHAALRDGLPPPLLVSAGGGFLAHCRALEQQDHTAARAFFQTHLAGFDTPTTLPAMLRPEIPGDPDQRPQVAGGLEPELADRLRARLAALDLGMADAVALAWGLVLARISGQGEAVFGLTRSGRYLLPESRLSAGCQINTLPCRSVLKPQGLEAALREQRAFSQTLQGFETTPLVEIAKVCDAPAGRPLFETILMFERRSLQAEFGGRAEEISRMAPLVTLAVSDDPAPGFRLEYDPSRLSAVGAAKLLGWFTRLLGAMAIPGDPPLAALSMLAPEEEAALSEFAAPPATAAQPELAEPLIARIEAAARLHGARPALILEEGAINHAELHARADLLAQHLRSEAIGSGDLVALALPRSPDYVIALLAVMKTGAAFLPLDLALPDAALVDMLTRSHCRLVLGSAELGARIGGHLPLLDPAALQHTDPAAPMPVPVPMRAQSPSPEALAYVIFTSGTTGQPKGVMIPERAIAAHAEAIRSAYALTPADRVLQFAGLGFDVALEEILPSLLAGAALVLRDDAMTASPAAFLARMEARGVSVANLPTAFWHLLVGELLPEGQTPAWRLPPALRLLIVGGERVSPTAIARWQRHYPDLRWLNGYGPTETTITATLGGPEPGSASIIGRPLAHIRCEVRLADNSLAPPGIAGELRIGGRGLGLGYLGRPDLTAAAFTGEGEARAYHSGDLVSWQPDGQLAYHGRIDRQIKLRGYRIEPGQIEARLEADPAVGTALVALEGKGAAARLLAWVSLGGASDPGAEARRLSAALAQSLPAHMLPIVLPVAAFPRTPGGKVDLGALPRPQIGTAEAEPQPEADPAVKRVQRIIEELLGQAPVGPDQSFFDLGGNSLLSIRLMGRLQQAFGRHLTLAALYRAPSPRGIAAELAQAEDGFADSLIPIQPGGTRSPLYAVHILGEAGAFFRPLAARLGADQPLLGLTLDLLDPDAPTELEAIAAIYRANIERHTPTGPVSLIAVSQGAWIAFEIACQLTAAGREVSGLYLLDADGPGGRPRSGRPHSARHYLTRLRRNFRGVVSGTSRKLSSEIGFHLARQWLRLARRLGIAARAPTIAAHQAAIDLAISRYRPGIWQGWITIFRATQQSHDTEEGIAGGLGWRVTTSAGTEVLDVAGNHLTMLREPHVADLAGKLAPLLRRGGAIPR